MATYLDVLPMEIHADILLFQPYDEIMRLAQELENFSWITTRQDLAWYFWCSKSKELGVTTKQFGKTALLPYKRYLQLYTYNRGCRRGSEIFINITICLSHACVTKDADLFEYFKQVDKRPHVIEHWALLTSGCGGRPVSPCS